MTYKILCYPKYCLSIPVTEIFNDLFCMIKHLMKCNSALIGVKIDFDYIEISIGLYYQN
ncbi:hypothetical protein MuYL_2453 [Mucilaginibacter xinganensis]|uniref:Uncharacterized protein n=1 Tax=Mucilaginibacter xinganensis TaxID=1234841 RepID=A0A223NX22_9SPHI|nr:hypothetical protein MuYL_2453 [Mucilaginibacter xinganensis]